jgi:hypothetical protein
MGWRNSSGGSARGFRHSSWIVRNGVITIASGGESPAMPSDHGRRFGEYQGIEELRPHSHPSFKLVRGEWRTARRCDPVSK